MNKRFRVWDKKESCFANPRQMKMGEMLMDFDGDLRVAIFPCGNGDNSADSVFDKILNSDEFIIEQFTGLYDKNGKEIFEGDILLFDVDYEELTEGGGNIIGVAVFTHGHYYFMDNKSDEPLHEFSEKRTEILDLKIIGNINENPELLNK